MTALDEAMLTTLPTPTGKALRRAVPKLGIITPLSGTPMEIMPGTSTPLLDICWPSGPPVSAWHLHEPSCL
jgi:hypothetical protein